MAQHYTTDSPLRVFEAFAGIGTQRMALDNLKVPHEVVAISEIDKYAIKSYEAIHGPVNNLGDISIIEPQDIPEHDLFTYSFPCQSLSSYGLQGGLAKGSGTTSSLLWDCERVIKHKRPKYLLMENVKALINKKNLPHFNEWLDLLTGYGYTNYYQVLNSEDYGIPQNRERVFVVSILGEHDNYTFKGAESKSISLTDILDRQVDERLYLTSERVHKLLNNTGYQHKDYQFNDPMYLKGQEEWEILGTVYYTASKQFQSSLFRRVSRTLKSNNNDIAVVLRHKDTQDIQIRRLTPLECFRLMGIKDDDFYKAQEACSNTQLYKQAGNAIVVNVLEAIFSQLFI